jgi:oxalate decarboxylase/phosphoglucose isomerase-like protein (cupin superfamily)
MSKNPVAVTAADVDTLIASYVTAKILAEPSISDVKNMSAVSIFFDPGQGHARHRHTDAEQLIFMVAGVAEMMMEFEEGQPRTQTIRAGDLVSIPKGVYHSTFNVGWEPVRILAVYSPAGPEAGMRVSDEFTVLPAGELAARRT